MIHIHHIRSWVVLVLLICLTTSTAVTAQTSSPCSSRSGVDPICPHSSCSCDGKLVRLANSTIVDCDDAISTFETDATYSNQQCNVLRFFIEIALEKSNCPCSGDGHSEIVIDPTPAPIPDASLPCADRSVDYQPCPRSANSQCCPNSGNLYPIFINNGRSKTVTCGAARSSLYDARSSSWSNSECSTVKMTVEGMIQVTGCSCTDDDDDSDSVPPPAPTSAPTTAVTASPTTAAPTTSAPTTPAPTTPVPTTTAPTTPVPTTTSPVVTFTTFEPSNPPIVLTAVAPVARESTGPAKLCSDRSSVANLCTFTGICDFTSNYCWTEPSYQRDLVRIPSGEFVECYEAYDSYLYDSTSQAWSDNDCYMVLLGLKTSCLCSQDTALPPDNETKDEEEEEGDGGSCFSGSSLVTVQGKGIIPMKELRLGDLVLTNGDDDDTYEPVYSFGHYEPKSAATTTLYQITTTTISSDDVVLEISPEHLMKNPSGQFRPAASFARGDLVMNEKGEAVEIRSMKRITKRDGLYAPFTPSGQLIVSGIQVSSFVAVLRDEEKDDTTFDFVSAVVSHQWLAHTFEFPHRLVCYYTTAWCPTETYNRAGLSPWVAQPLEFSQWLFSSSSLRLFKSLLQCVILIILFFFNVVESTMMLCCTTVGCMLLFLGVGATMARTRTTRLCMKRIPNKTTTC